jgi:hypothetical protein
MLNYMTRNADTGTCEELACPGTQTRNENTKVCEEIPCTNPTW